VEKKKYIQMCGSFTEPFNYILHIMTKCHKYVTDAETSNLVAEYVNTGNKLN